MRRQIDASSPAPASFLLGAGGVRTVFPLADVTSILFSRQTATAGPLRALAGRDAVPLALPGQHRHGRLRRLRLAGLRDRRAGDPRRRAHSPASRRCSGRTASTSTCSCPPGARPAGGWPVAIFGHGFGDNKNSSPFIVASSLARRGIATVAINVVGHGGGELGTLTVSRASGAPVSFAAGGRGIDQDGNGTIDATEGSSAAAPQTIVSSRDGLRQTVIDLMQLVREIQVGMDVDGDGTRDLDPARISYFGQSFGGIYGTKFLAVEPDVRTGVVNVPGGAIIEIARLSPVFRGLVTLSLIARTPSLVKRPSLGTRTCLCATSRRSSTRCRAQARSSRRSSGRSG